MRFTSSILAVAISVASIIIGPVASSETATLRYDGTYRHIGADKTTQHLRFYPDGFMMSAATPSAETPRWFYRGYPNLPTGRYSNRGGRIQITLNVNLPDGLPEKYRGSIPRALHYTGVIKAGYLELKRDGAAAPQRYDFVKSAASK